MQMNREHDRNDANPYRTPRSAIAPATPTAYGEIKAFSARGRLGRVRYVGYSVGLGLSIGFAGGLLGGVTALLEGDDDLKGLLAGGAFVVLALVALVASVLFAVQRLHDFDARGWWALLAPVPLANVLFYLMLLIMPGTRGPNRFGNPPPPNTAGAIVLALILPMVAVIGMVAAVAVPAYQHYLERASEAGRR